MIEFDANKKALFNPQNLNFQIPIEQAILVFDDDTWEDYIFPNHNLTTLPVKNNRGRIFSTYRLISHHNQPILLVYPSAGGSASVMETELLIASGIKKIVAFGTCGSMHTQIAQNTLLIPTVARREEGTSYHYLPPSDEIAQNPTSIKAIQTTFDNSNEGYQLGKIWTIDAIYRETPTKLQKLQSSGYIGVDMELASLLALAEFRQIQFAEFLIADDNIAGKPQFPPKTKDPAQLLNLALSILEKL